MLNLSYSVALLDIIPFATCILCWLSGCAIYCKAAAFVAIFYRAILWYYNTHVVHCFNCTADYFCTAMAWPQRSKEEERLISIAGLVKQFLLSIEYYCSEKVNIWSCSMVTSKCLSACVMVCVSVVAQRSDNQNWLLLWNSQQGGKHSHTFYALPAITFFAIWRPRRGRERERLPLGLRLPASINSDCSTKCFRSIL